MGNFSYRKTLAGTFIAVLAVFVFLVFFVLFKQINFQNHAPVVLGDSNSVVNTEIIRKISKSINDKCMKVAGDGSCYVEAIENELLSKYKIEQVLAGISDYDQDFSCHAFTHFLGRALYKETKSISGAYSVIDFTCHGGTFHGVLEAFLKENETDIKNIDGQKLTNICTEAKEKAKTNNEQVNRECFHGWGHAFMFLTGNHLPFSLKYCDRIDAIENKDVCYGGVFMENTTSSTSPDHPTEWVSQDDKFYPCTVLKIRT